MAAPTTDPAHFGPTTGPVGPTRPRGPGGLLYAAIDPACGAGKRPAAAPVEGLPAYPPRLS